MLVLQRVSASHTVLANRDGLTMDPLSIATGSAGLVVLCVRISTILYNWIRDTSEVDSNVSGLCEEIVSLSRTLDAISTSWRQNRLVAAAQVDPDGNLWASVGASLNDCKTTLEALDDKLNSVRKTGFLGKGFLRKPTKQVKFNLKMNDIVTYRQRFQSYNTAMASALQMINV